MIDRWRSEIKQEEWVEECSFPGKKTGIVQVTIKSFRDSHLGRDHRVHRHPLWALVFLWFPEEGKRMNKELNSS